MTQQIIIDLKKNYPFGQIQLKNNKNTVYVRKILSYSTKQQYEELREKINFIKSLKQTYLIKILNILEGVKQLHLYYEYIPFRYQNSKIFYQKDHQLNVKNKLIQFALDLSSKSIMTSIEFKNIGLDKTLEIKYYLDVEQLAIKKNVQYSIKNVYISQVNKLFYNINEESYDNPQQSYYAQNPPQNKQSYIKTENNKEQNSNRFALNKINPKIYQNGETDKVQKPRNKMNSLEALQRIEQKINQLKTSSDKYSKNLRDTFKIKETLRQTLKENWKKQKIDTRKMSGHTIYDSHMQKFMQKKVKPSSKVNINTNQQSMSQTQTKKAIDKSSRNKKPFQQQLEESDYTFGKIQNHKSVRKESMKKKKQPINKKDFEQIRKHEFQNFFNSKQSYVHQFLGILSDNEQENGQKKIQITKYEKNNKQNMQDQRKIMQQYKSIQKSNQTSNIQKKAQLIHNPIDQSKVTQSTSSAFDKNKNSITKKKEIPSKLRQNNYFDEAKSIRNSSTSKKINQLLKCQSLEKSKFLNSQEHLIDEEKAYSMRGCPMNVKQKISKAIKDSDLVLQKFRKNSLISIYTSPRRKKQN